MAVEFNEPTYGVSSIPTRKQGGLTAFVIKLGLAKDEKQAQMALIVILVIVIVLTLAVLFLGNSDSGAAPGSQIPPEQLIVQ